MKTKKVFMLSLLLVFLLNFSIASAFDSGSTGTLGAFNPPVNTEVILPPDGILNYTTVNIPSGVTVTFLKNTANTPAYMLASGDVTIAGTIDISGEEGSSIYPGKSGIGGFEGGYGGSPGDGSNPSLPGGKGLGPGGGGQGVLDYVLQYGSSGGGGGGFGSNGTNGKGTSYAAPGTGGSSYGNAKLLPMIGGSGGGGGASSPSYTQAYGGAGGSGGGALLIASSGTITLTGSIISNGGKGADASAGYAGGGGGASGGAIKLMADTITGSGTISAIGGALGAKTGLYGYDGGAGGSGRIRFESNSVTGSINTTPANTHSPLGNVFIPNIPTLKITSIGGVNVPANPTGTYGIPDVTLPSTTNPVTLVVSATNIPVSTHVTVIAIPQYGISSSGDGNLSGTDTSSTASISLSIDTTYECILMAQVTYTVQTAMYYEGEKIEKVRVASAIGGKSQAVYITEKGREIPAEMLFAKLMQ